MYHFYKKLSDDEASSSSSSLSLDDNNASIVVHFSDSDDDLVQDEEGYDADDEQTADKICSICLVPIRNKAFASTCFHQFCYECLLEWSRVRASCPLCNEPFDRIIYHCHSVSDFKECYCAVDADGMAKESWIVGKQCAPVSFRTLVYDHEWYVDPTMKASIDEGAMQYEARERRRFRAHLSDAEWYRANEPRLVSWIVRDVAAIRHEEISTLTLLQILGQLKADKCDDLMDKISDLLQCTRKTSQHFMHELMAFAASPYKDMVEYDAQTVYFQGPAVNKKFPTWSMLPVNLSKYRLTASAEQDDEKRHRMGERLKLASHFCLSGGDKENYVKRVLLHESVKRGVDEMDTSSSSSDSSMSEASSFEYEEMPSASSPDLTFVISLSSDDDEPATPAAPPPTPLMNKETHHQKKKKRRSSGAKRNTQQKTKSIY